MPFATMQLANFIMDSDVTQAQVAGAIDTYTAQMQRMETIIKRPEFTRDQSRDGADLIRKLTETMNAATHEATDAEDAHRAATDNEVRAMATYTSTGLDLDAALLDVERAKQDIIDNNRAMAQRLRDSSTHVESAHAVAESAFARASALAVSVAATDDPFNTERVAYAAAALDVAYAAASLAVAVHDEETAETEVMGAATGLEKHKLGFLNGEFNHALQHVTRSRGFTDIFSRVYEYCKLAVSLYAEIEDDREYIHDLSLADSDIANAFLAEDA